jgi:acyl carrier protein
MSLKDRVVAGSSTAFECIRAFPGNGVPQRDAFCGMLPRDDGRGTVASKPTLEFRALALDARRTCRMDVLKEVNRTLDEVLSLNGRGNAFTRDTPLLGAIPELDSMAVVTLITTLEERFDMIVDDDEIGGDTFASVGALADFVAAKLAS